MVRAKTNARFKISSWKRWFSENIISDVTGTITVCKSSKVYPEEHRKVIVIDRKDGTKYIFLINNLEDPATFISKLYLNHGSVNLFFKWIKQYLRIKKIWEHRGTLSEAKSIVS